MNTQTEIFDLTALVGETYRATPYQPTNSLYVTARVCAEHLDLEHSCTSYFFTIGLGKSQNRTLDQEWKHFGLVITNVLESVYTNNLVAAIVVGVEMYSKNKGRPNTKALRPHMHMTIFAYNDFLCAPLRHIEREFCQQGLDFKIDRTTPPKNTAKTLCYTVKSARQKPLRKATNHYFGIEPVNIVINPTIINNPINDFVVALRTQNIPFTTRIIHTTECIQSVSRFNGDTKIQMADFLRKQCIQSQTAFYNGFIMVKQEPAQFTWVKKGDVANFLESAVTPNMPDTYRQAMYNSAQWILQEGALDSKDHPVQHIFPRLQIQPNLWEFLDQQVYDFQTGTLIQNAQLAQFTSCNKFIPMTWNKVTQPTLLLEILGKLIPDQKEKDKFLVTLGGLFHNLGNRKDHKAMWIHGQSNTFKTWFVTCFLEATFNEILVHQISRSRTQFKYGRLRGVTEGILYIDEFRSDDFQRPAQFLQITDGQTTVIEEKYRPAEDIQFKGHSLLTTNRSIQQTNYSPDNKRAFQVRFQETHFNPSEEDVQCLIQATNSEELQHQWTALAIWANTKYLQKAYSGKHTNHPANWETSTTAIATAQVNHKTTRDTQTK